MPATPLLLDTCVVLSLYATRRTEEILRATTGPFAIVEAVARETLYIQVLTDGVREQEPVDLNPFFTSGLLQVLRPESDDEFQTLIHYAMLLDDGEAMTCALATQRGYRIATDEKKTIRLLGSQVSILGTLDVVRAWEEADIVPGSIMREVLAAIEERGYIPGSTHPYFAWWRMHR